MNEAATTTTNEPTSVLFDLHAVDPAVGILAMLQGHLIQGDNCHLIMTNKPNMDDHSTCPSCFITPARMSVDELRRLAAANKLELHLTWRWVGRSRHGVLTVTKDGIQLFSESFSRSTRMWGAGDEKFELVRTGSPKHRVVMKAVASLTDSLATPAKPVLAGRRRNSGISDPLKNTSDTNEPGPTVDDNRRPLIKDQPYSSLRPSHNQMRS